jgi:tripartite ATP-independent transporter DctM subunit
MLISLLGFLALFVLAFAGVPLGIAMLAVGTAGFAWYRGVEPALAMSAQQTVDVAMSYGMSVIPLFVVMGAFIFKSGMADDLFGAAQRWLGHLRGGLAHAALGACAGFGAVCGSSLATAATMTRVAEPEMRKHGYDPSFSGATIAAGGTLGILIPPSVPMVIYGILTETDIAKLFAAGVVPGLLLMLLYMAAVWAVAVASPAKVGRRTHASWRERLTALRGTAPVLGLFLVVLGGLYIGVFTPTESAGIGAAGALAFMVMRGRASRRAIGEALSESTLLSAGLLTVTIGASVFTNFLTISGLTAAAGAWVQSLDVSPLGVILAMCAVYFVLGCFFDSLAMIFLTIPVFFPIIAALHIDPVWFGIIVLIVVELGLLTPPLGMNVFIVKALIPEAGTWAIFREIGVFVIAALVCLALVIWLPQIALWVPSLM